MIYKKEVNCLFLFNSKIPAVICPKPPYVAKTDHIFVYSSETILDLNIPKEIKEVCSQYLIDNFKRNKRNGIAKRAYYN